MTNPDNAVGTNAAYGGRTSVNAFNDDLGGYTRGVLSGWACVPNSGLTVSIGGSGDVRDVAVAEDAAGNKTTINNISASPIDVTISAAPASNTRIDAIVAYVDASPQGSATITDNYEACGLITVLGTASSSPVAPNDSTIRTAITADGASGATAYYAVLAYITIANGTTDITSANISAGEPAVLSAGLMPTDVYNQGSYSTDEINTGCTWVDGRYIFKKTLINTLSGNNNSVDTTVNNIDLLIDWKNIVLPSATRQYIVGFRYGGIGTGSSSESYLMMATQFNKDENKLLFEFGNNYTGQKTVYTTIYYVKTS